jgi:adenylate kinase family enzyme
MTVPQELVLDLMEERMLLHREAEGFIIAGFPRDVLQASAFQSRSHHSSGIFCFYTYLYQKRLKIFLRFECCPRTVLLDCSELELGRSLVERQDSDKPAPTR